MPAAGNRRAPMRHRVTTIAGAAVGLRAGIARTIGETRQARPATAPGLVRAVAGRALINQESANRLMESQPSRRRPSPGPGPSAGRRWPVTLKVARTARGRPGGDHHRPSSTSVRSATAVTATAAGAGAVVARTHAARCGNGRDSGAAVSVEDRRPVNVRRSADLPRARFVRAARRAACTKRDRGAGRSARSGDPRHARRDRPRGVGHPVRRPLVQGARCRSRGP